MEKMVIFAEANETQSRARVKSHNKATGKLTVIMETGRARGTTRVIDEETVYAVAEFKAVQPDATGRPVI